MTLRYICFEGIDGAGKSLQISLLSEFLIRQGVTPVCLHEPSYGKVGLEIRRRAAEGTLGDLEDQHALFTRDRRDHVRSKIQPLLASAATNPAFMILQSRSYLSAAAYQSDSDDPSVLAAIIEGQERIAPAPDVILLLDLPVETALARLRGRRRLDMFEEVEKLRRARQRYLQISQFRSQCVLIEAGDEPAAVASRIRDVIASRGGWG